MRLAAVQQFRAVAALLVVVHHCLSTVNQYGFEGSLLARTGNFYFFSNAGVDIFFVISGFIMMYTITRRGGDDTWRAFLWRRIKRVMPLYWVLTTFLLALMLLAPGLFADSRPDWLHTIASYLLLPYPDSQGRMFPMLVPGWTLTFEMIFYGVFASLLFLRTRFIVPALATIFGAFLLLVEILGPETRALVWLANPIVFEFVFGCFVARVCLSLRSPPLWLPYLLGGIAALMFSASILVDLSWMPRALAWGVPSLFLIAAAALAKPPAQPARNPGGLAALGDASYSLYLVHPFVLPAVAMLWRGLGLHHQLPADLYVMTATILSCGLALVTYQFLERPLATLTEGRKARPPAVRLRYGQNAATG